MVPSVPAPPARRRSDVVRWAAVRSRWIVVVVLGTSAVLGLLGHTGLPVSWTPAAVLVLAGVGFVAGMPHGAVDHVLLSRLAGRSLVAASAAYGACAVVVWVLLRWGGPVPLLVVVLLSVVHFGTGELDAHPGGGPRTALAVASTGALLLPLARSGVEMRGVASALSPGLGTLVGSGGFRAGVAALWLVAASIAAVGAARTGRLTVLLDVVLVGALGAVAPPLVAFGVWFGGWHALRHGGRLLTVEPGCAALVRSGHTREAVRRLAGIAVLPSLAAVLTLGVIAALTVAAPDLPGAVAEALRVLLALTVPHMLVVLWLDRRAVSDRR